MKTKEKKIVREIKAAIMDGTWGGNERHPQKGVAAAGAEQTDHKAFLTGSHCYGTPTKDSDIDIMVRMNEADAHKLSFLTDNPDEVERGPHGSLSCKQSISVKVGRLNLLVCLTDRAWEVWRDGTRRLWERRPVTREKAVKTFKRLRQEAGIE